MAAQNSVAVRDNSTLTNFKQWAQIISNFFTTAGWLQSTDTGQVNWSTIATVPTGGNYVYEIWEPNDGLTNFFLKIEYGTNASSTNGPQLRLSVGTGTNGAGTLTGFIAGPFLTPQGAVTVTSAVTQFQCYLSGAAGRMGVAMWVDDTTNTGPIAFVVARSKNSSGSNTSDNVSLIVCGGNAGITIANPYGMQTIRFGVGVAPAIPVNSGSPIPILPAIMTNLSSNAFATTNVPVSPIFPSIGFFDNPLIEVGVAASGDITDQASFTIAAANMPYGVSHTFKAFKNPPLNDFGAHKPGNGGSNFSLVLLYE